MSDEHAVPDADRPDPLVARALRDLPVPDHRLTFWADLDAAIREEAATAAATSSGADAAEGDLGRDRLPAGEVPVLRHAPPPPSLARRAAPWLAAAAGFVLVGAAAGFVLSSGGDGGDDVAGSTTSAVLLQSTTVPPPSTTAEQPTASTAPPDAAETDPAEVARSFIQALGDGDSEAALQLLGPRSLAYIEATAGDPLGFVTEMQEGYGAWAGAPDLALSAAVAGVVPPLESELAVVTVQGTHPGEGEPQARVDAFPLVRDGDRWVVELVAFAPGRENRLRFTVPRGDADGSLGPMAPDGEINVFVPAPGTVLFQLDGGELHRDETAEIPAGTFSLHAPPEPLAPGEHVLVAVAVGQDGTIVGFGGRFLVPG